MDSWPPLIKEFYQEICDSCNKQIDLHSFIFESSALLRLDLDNLALETIPSSTGNIASLQALNLRNNRLKDLPMQLENLKAL